MAKSLASRLRQAASAVGLSTVTFADFEPSGSEFAHRLFQSSAQLPPLAKGTLRPVDLNVPRELVALARQGPGVLVDAAQRLSRFGSSKYLLSALELAEKLFPADSHASRVIHAAHSAIHTAPPPLPSGVAAVASPIPEKKKQFLWPL